MTTARNHREFAGRLPLTRRFPLSRIDTIGLVLVAALGAWILYDAWLTYGWAMPMLLTLLLCTAAYVGGRLAARYVRWWLVPTIVLALAAGLLYLLENPNSSLYFSELIHFLNYQNSRAALFVQAAFAGVMITAGQHWRKGHPSSGRFTIAASLAASGVFVHTALAIRSTGGRVTAALLVPALYVAFQRKARRATIVFASAVWIVAVIVSLLLAEAFSRDADSELVARAGYTLGFGRVALWSEGYELFRDHLSTGVGPDQFRLASVTARSRPDVLQWAHNEYLQQAAETGVIGLVLLIAIIGWIFVRLAKTPTALSAVGALAVAALAIHACVDYLLHFPILSAITSALAGSATGRERTRRRRQRASTGADSAIAGFRSVNRQSASDA